MGSQTQVRKICPLGPEDIQAILSRVRIERRASEGNGPEGQEKTQTNLRQIYVSRESEEKPF
jgi:hypothetical protein